MHISTPTVMCRYVCIWKTFGTYSSLAVVVFTDRLNMDLYIVLFLWRI